MCRCRDEFHTDDYWGGDDYDCPADDPSYNEPSSRGFHTDDCWGGNDYDCPDDVPRRLQNSDGRD